MTTFRFAGTEHEYFHHPVNTTWNNERCVEIPIILAAVHGRAGSMLEVGNVLSQYVGRHKWTTVDLLEKEDSVVNEDIVDWEGGPFDLIVSISTFEHVGVDQCGDRFRAIDAVRNCANHLLAPGGRLLFTVPVGYNPVLDAWLMWRWSGNSRYLLRVSRDNRWVETDREPVQNAKYGKPFGYGNAVIVGEWRRSRKKREKTGTNA